MTERPYIPGYLFCFFDIEIDPWPRINSTRGVKRLLPVSRPNPTAMPEAVMAVLLAKCNGKYVDAPEVDTEIARVLFVGAKVSLRDGALVDHRGRIEWTDQERVRVLLSIFNRPTRVTVPARSVEIVL